PRFSEVHLRGAASSTALHLYTRVRNMVAGRAVLPQGDTGSLDPRPCHGAVQPALAGLSVVSRLFARSPGDGERLWELEEVARTRVRGRHRRISQWEACIR